MRSSVICFRVRSLRSQGTERAVGGCSCRKASFWSSCGFSGEMEARMKKYRQASPERAKVWTEKSPKYQQSRKVPVVYYLCRNRQLEHPHFIEVPLSSPEGLYLRGESKATAIMLMVEWMFVCVW